MANALLAWGNLADEAVLSGGAFTVGLPLTNAQDRLVGLKARTVNTDPSSTWFDIDLTTDQLVRTLALIGHNAALSATYRVIGDRTSDFADPSYDSGWKDIWPAVYDTSQLEWEATNFWDGRYLAKELKGQVWKLVHALPENRYLRFWRVEIRDTSGGNAYFQFGRLFIAAAWQPVRNIIYDGFGLGVTTSTEVQETLDGGRVFDRKAPQREGRFTTELMTEDEAFGYAFEIQLQAGIDGEVLYIVDPDDTKHASRRQIFGTLSALNAIENPYAFLEGYRTAWSVLGV